MNRTAVFTVVFPAIGDYLYDYKESLLKQTFSDFDLILVNDGYDIKFLETYFKEFNLTILPPGLTRAKHREEGIRYAKATGYEYLILCDGDDFFYENRFEETLEVFANHNVDIVVNDLDIVNERGEVITQSYFSKRINEHTQLDSNFLLSKNIFGLSNTAIRLDTIPEVIIPSSLKIVDWYLFAYLMEYKAKAFFACQPLTYYRQHESNAIGINKMSVEIFKKQLLLKIDHFKHLSDMFPKYSVEYQRNLEFLQLSDKEIDAIIDRNSEISNPLWWEIINK